MAAAVSIRAIGSRLLSPGQNPEKSTICKSPEYTWTVWRVRILRKRLAKMRARRMSDQIIVDFSGFWPPERLSVFAGSLCIHKQIQISRFMHSLAPRPRGDTRRPGNPLRKAPAARSRGQATRRLRPNAPMDIPREMPRASPADYRPVRKPDGAATPRAGSRPRPKTSWSHPYRASPRRGPMRRCR